MECPRCRGLMVMEEFCDLRSDVEQNEFLGWHCLLCGEVVDPVIRMNRRRSVSGLGVSTPVAQLEFAGLDEEVLR